LVMAALAAIVLAVTALLLARERRRVARPGDPRPATDEPPATEPPLAALPRRDRLIAWTIATVLCLALVAVRLRYPWTFEYEAEEASISSARFVLHGVPPQSFHRIRYMGVFVGPLHAWLKSIPYLFDLDPRGDLLQLVVLNALGGALLFFLLRRLFGLGA